MQKRNILIYVLVGIIIVGALFVFFYHPTSKPTDPTIDVKTNTKISATTVNVATFYDGQNGYSVSIPSGNSSTCIWTYVDGNAAIPYSETTQAKTATEKHTIHISDTATDWKVSCVDDFGNQYTGIFPK
ncbi:MAG: hypothetical protein ABSA74_02230 [Candidatus Staskawiczbacteria bacterium]|jgi:hypothetical protein